MPSRPKRTLKSDQLADPVSEEFRCSVTDAFRTFTDSRNDLKDTPLPQKVNLFSTALSRIRSDLQSSLRESCDSYFAIASANSDELGVNPLGWVSVRITADLDFARDEQRICTALIAACDENEVSADVARGEWRAPIWLVRFASRPEMNVLGLDETELLQTADLAVTERSLKMLQLRLWTALSRSVHHSLLRAAQRIDLARKLKKDCRSRGIAPGQPASVQRARFVGNVLNELNALRIEMQVPEDDYNKFRSQNKRAQIIRLADKHPAFKEKLMAIQEHRQLIRLAQEAATLKFQRTLSTIQTDWKRNKPHKYRRPRSLG
jgi:hypothetical protein